MLSDYFDRYSLNARVRPALLALLPLTVSIYALFPDLYELFAGAVSVLVIFGFVTGLAHFARYRGRIIEKKLFDAWGEKPTTRMLRHSDSSIDPVTKARYHNYLAENINGWAAPTNDEEAENPRKADHAYAAAVTWLLEQTRDLNRFSMLFNENISYGFRRNCYGIKWFGVSLSSLPSALISIWYYTQLTSPNELPFEQSVLIVCFGLSLLMGLWWMLLVNKAWVKDASESYALRLLASCDA
ncbi:hypothetical protein [Neptuniibacter sp. QD37_11]|uniref:hypothetical protein n=1 Tax=Neptuniibacter sp. QD37_11 TaxID=3398209 RepID=UPI0039F4526D